MPSTMELEAAGGMVVEPIERKAAYPTEIVLAHAASVSPPGALNQYLEVKGAMAQDISLPGNMHVGATPPAPRVASVCFFALRGVFLGGLKFVTIANGLAVNALTLGWDGRVSLTMRQSLCRGSG